MAKVETITFKVFAKSYPVTLFFRPRDAMFWLKLPEEMGREVMGVNSQEQWKFTNSDYSSLLQEVHEKIEVCERLKLQEHAKDVILYEVTLDCGFEYRDAKGRKRSLYLNSHRRDGTGIGLKYRVVSKQTYRGKTVYKEKSQDNSSVQKCDNEQEMPFTPERLAFFEEVKGKLEALILQFHQFFTRHEPTQLAQLIDKGGKFLTGPTPRVGWLD